MTTVFAAFAALALASSAWDLLFVAGIVATGWSIVVFRTPFSVVLYGNGEIIVHYVLSTRVFAVDDVQAVRHRRFREGWSGWRPVWPEYVIEFSGARVSVPLGPFGGQRFRKAVAKAREEAVRSGALRGGCR